MARRLRIPIPPANLATSGRVQLRGMREYQEKLVRLGNDMIGRGCITALAPGADVMRDAVRARTPVLQQPDPRRRPGVLRNAITAMHVASERFAATYVIGIKLLSARAIGAFKRKTGRDSRNNPDDPFYGTILEFGKTPRTRHPFVRPGFQASAERAVKVAFSHLQLFTDAAIRRIGGQR